jgi:hypothetical protein
VGERKRERKRERGEREREEERGGVGRERGREITSRLISYGTKILQVMKTVSLLMRSI